MLYTAGEILLFLVVAALVGFGVGWTARDLSRRSRVEAGFERDISSRQRRINALEDELRQAQDQLEAAESALEQAENRIEEEQAAVLTVRARLDEAESAAAQMRARVEVLTDELAAVRQAAATSTSNRAPLEVQVPELTIQLEGKDDQLAEVRSQADAVPDPAGAGEGPEPAAGTGSPGKGGLRSSSGRVNPAAWQVGEMISETARAGGKGEMPAPASSPPLVSRTGTDLEPVGEDDLTRIHGIGPKIERTLKSLGIISYRQIAQLTDDDIDRLGDHLGHFRDRIRRDNWMASAAELHRKRYGTEP